MTANHESENTTIQFKQINNNNLQFNEENIVSNLNEKTTHYKLSPPPPASKPVIRTDLSPLTEEDLVIYFFTFYFLFRNQ